jgi:tetraacyldisaccharide 4'-kinase
MNISPSKFVHLNSGKSYPVDQWPMHKEVHAVAGLGNPGRFFDTLSRLGFNHIKHPFPDHHKYITTDLHFLDHHPILMTEKDASKCKHFNNNKIWYLAVEADLSNQFINELDNRLKKIT